MNPQRPPHDRTFLGLSLCLLFFTLNGCGSKSDGPSVVTPPNSDQADLKTGASTAAGDAPGTMQLPEVEIPAQQPSAESASPGLELPDVPIKKETAAVDYASWEEIEKFATSRRRITVVDLWSTVCAPCVKEFPGLVKLHAEHGNAIQCISVSVDYDGRKSRPPESYEETVSGFLTSQGATFPNYISRTPSDEVLETLDVVSIPAVLIFDAEGNLVKRFIDADETAGFSYEKDIIPFVTKLAG